MQLYLQKSNKQKTRKDKLLFVGVLKVIVEKITDPDPLVRGMDPRIQIRTKLSLIRNTEYTTAMEEKPFCQRNLLKSRYFINYCLNCL